MADLFKLDLPGEDPPAPERTETADAQVVKLFPSEGDVEPTAEADAPKTPSVLNRIIPAVERSAARFADGWRAGWVGDGVLGMRPRPVADLVRQFWTAPPAYVADAWILRIPYALYGLVVIPVSAAGHLVLFVISYPSLLAGALLLAIFLSLFL